MDIKLLSGALGAEVDGINLKDSTDKNFKIINDLLLEHKVIFWFLKNIKNFYIAEIFYYLKSNSFQSI